jgi:uncharacterized membrane protein HdeD (DUF308 family)/pimeloyl-ACP methyl ester carboxylesterase
VSNVSALTKLKSLTARHLPWWLVLVLGIGCVALGGVLTADPSWSLSVLEWLVAAALILTGLSELAGAESSARPRVAQATATVWIIGGVIAVAWPGITIRALAIVVGIALIMGGALKLRSAFFGEGDERFVLGLSGAATIVVGLLALSWPGVSVLVLAILFGVRTILFGAGQVVLALRMRGGRPTPRRWPRPLRLIGASAVLLVALAAATVSAAIDRAAPNAPGAFYTAPSPLPSGPPGTIIRSEAIDGFHAGATTYRVLYKSTGYDGKPTAVSGFIVVPDGPAPTKGRDVLAYTHGTVGVAPSCAPSLAKAADQPLFLEGGAALLAAGYVIASSDYQGLGTPEPHPYLVGASEAMNELDAVRAAHNLAQAHAGTQFAVWGHSQGGHAALFTGQLAPAYAPELHLVGVAAGAPVPNLVDLFKVNIKTTIGKVLIAMAVQSWETVYHDAKLDQIVTPAARPIVSKIARNCLYNQTQILGSVPGALALGVSFLHTPPWEAQPWKTIAEDNTPGGAPTKAPLLIVQGAADTIVAPDVTERLVHKLCQQGETVEFRLYPGVGHLVTGHEAAPAVASWIADRFAGKPPPTSCT